MCLACLEYIKGNMKLKEYKAALREFGQDEDHKDHVEKAQTIIYDHDGDEDALKKKLASVSS